MHIQQTGINLWLLAVVTLTTLSTSAYSAPEVAGNTISWPDDGWYQVQLASDFTSLCEGGSSCDVEPGEYIVINHTSGERFTGIVVSESGVQSEVPEEQNNPATPTLDGSTIRFGNDDWYQVQRADNFITICEGRDPCSVDEGSYIVINHTTGRRFAFEITEPGNTGSDSSAINVVDTTISWPDDGWYQVQDATDFRSICEGTTRCTVAPGSYIVINHSTGQRTEITVNADADPSTPDTPERLINENSWPDILAQVVSAIDGQPLELIDQTTRDNHFLLENSQPPGALLEIERLPLQASNEFLLRLDCILGGRASVQYTRDVTIETDWNYDNCQLFNETRNGRHLFSNQGSREGGSLTRYENFSVTPNADTDGPNDEVLELDGTRTTTADRIQYAQSRSWSDTDLNSSNAAMATLISAYNMMSEKRTGLNQRNSVNRVFIRQADGSFAEARFIENNATLAGSFSIQSFWTLEQTVSVSVNLQYQGDYVEGGGAFENSGQTVTGFLAARDDAFSIMLEMTPQQDNAVARWNTGRISITATDGSSIELDAATGDINTFSVSINNEQAISWPWTADVTPVCLGPFEGC